MMLGKKTTKIFSNNESEFEINKLQYTSWRFGQHNLRFICLTCPSLELFINRLFEHLFIRFVFPAKHLHHKNVYSQVICVNICKARNLIISEVKLLQFKHNTDTVS